MVELTYYGHSAFMLKAGKTALVVDPFFTGNTWQIAQADDIRCDYIFVSHGHDDHYGDSGCIGKANDALFISTPEVVKELAEKDGLRSDYLHLGGKADYPFGCIRLVPAFHGSGVAGGHAAGALINFFGKNIYYAGDTAFFSDMGLLNRFGPIDYALLPIGDRFTMGMDDALLAASYVKAAVTIPVHYGTWPIIEGDPLEFVDRLYKDYGQEGLHVKPGMKIIL